MPTFWSEVVKARRYCTQPFKWSQMRGGCRFAPGHAGACKPGRYR